MLKGFAEIGNNGNIGVTDFLYLSFRESPEVVKTFKKAKKKYKNIMLLRLALSLATQPYGSDISLQRSGNGLASAQVGIAFGSRA